MAITVIRSIIIYFFITLAVRVMGKRQIGELNPQELIITILISAVATVPLEDNAMPLANSLLPISIFIALEIINSALSMKSKKFRYLVQGRPVFVIKNGKIQQKELTKLRFTVDDLIDAIRQSGEFDISRVANAIVETNGTLTIQQKAEYSPVVSKDLGLKVEASTVPITIVMDSEPIKEYFSSIVRSEDEIRLIAAANGEQVQNIFLMTVDEDGKAYIVRKDEQ